MALGKTVDIEILSKTQLAVMLGKSEGFVEESMDALYKAGFPRRIDALKGWSRPAVLAWIEAQSRGEAA